MYTQTKFNSIYVRKEYNILKVIIMITNKSIYKAELIEFNYNENGKLIEKKDNLINNTMVVIDQNYVVDIKTHKELEIYNIKTQIEPGKKYIYKLYSPGNVDIELYTKALIAFNDFIDEKFKDSNQGKILQFKPKKTRDK